MLYNYSKSLRKKNHEYIFGRIKLILTLNCKLPPTECTVHIQNNYMKCRYCTRVRRESKQQEKKNITDLKNE